VTHCRGPCPLRRCAAPLLALALVASPPPALAADAPPTAPQPAPLTVLAQANLAATALAPTLKAQATPPATQATPATGPDRSTWAFFKSPGGIVVLSTLAVGVGYWIYSTQNDRINSPGKN